MAPKRKFKVVIKFAAKVPTTLWYCPVGRSFYSSDLGRQPLGGGLESWRDFYQSIRPTQMGLSLDIVLKSLFLRADVSSTAFIEQLPVIDFVTKLLDRDDSARPLSDADCVKMNRGRSRIGVKVEVTHRGNMKNKWDKKNKTFNAEPVLPVLSCQHDQVGSVLEARFHDVTRKLQPQRKELELLIVILHDKKGSLYGNLKRILETDLGIVSQCCLQKNVYQMSRSYLDNMAQKIKVKVGERNMVLVDALHRRIPFFHGCCFQEPEVTKYAGLVCAQAHRQELIEDLCSMIKDGVGESQFHQVLFHELTAISKACNSLEETYQPPVTFVVVQKRHHTRLFADKSGNVPAGKEFLTSFLPVSIFALD
ncbi:hypothetical protein Pfo_015754 [Paulownia fortunei]|nr:hypothetical protein Pfo_015754 [Paulownia fortunei]